MIIHWCLAIVIAISAPKGECVPLYVGALLPLSNHWFQSYSNFLVVIFQFAFDEINNRTDILNGYELQVIPKDTQGIPGLAAKRFMELIDEPPKKVALLGPAMSDELIVVGQMPNYFNMLELSFIASTSSLTDRDAYPAVYMTNYIAEALNPVRIRLMKYFKWKRVATLAYKDDIFTSQITDFHKRLELNNFTLVTSGIVTDSSQVSEHIQRLKQYDARIIVGAFRSTKAPFIFCEAYKQGLYGEKFVWILPRSSMYDNWIDNADPNSYPCTREELIKATKGYITINHKRLSESTDVTFSGRTPQEYNELVNNMADASPYLLSRSHPLGYDTAYTLALTLNKTEQRLQEMNRSLTMFDYNDGITLEVMKSAIENVSFEGVSGPVAYTEDGRRVGIAYIEYNNYNVTTAMASYDPRDDSITWFQDSKQLFEGKSTCAKDRFIYQEINEPYSRTAFISVLFLDTVGVVIGIFFFAFNVKYRKNRHIKMSSPHINNFIILGCLVMYLAVYFNTLDYGQYFDSTLRNSICMIKLWTSLLGFTLAFGALFSKTWRVHVLFRHSAMKKRSIKDYQLFGMLLVLTLVDLVILIPWTIFHPLQKEEIKFQSEDLSNSDTVVTVIYTECRHPFDIYWYASEYIYKGLLLVFGVFLAWENRMVSVPALNDSKLIGFCVYNVVVVCAFGVPIGHVLAVQQSTLLFILSSIFTTFCTTLVLCILFIPKFRLRHKTGDLRFVNSLNENLKTQSTLSNVNNTPQTQPAWTVQNEDTHHEVAVLKKKLVDEKNAINRLKMDIEKITNNEVNVHKVDGEYIVVKTVSDNSSV